MPAHLARCERERPHVKRTAWHLRVGIVVLAWLTAALTVGVVSLFADVPHWLLVHVLLLGAVSNAILIWSSHFAASLLRLSDADSRRGEAMRITLFNIGALVVVIAMTTGAWPVVVLGGAIVAVSATWHARILTRWMRRALPSRFGLTVRYYISASCLLPVGVAIGVVMARDELDETWHARLALAHVSVNLLGWMCLTVLGTLVTLWPTMLHTKVADGAERDARRALPVLLLSLAIIGGGALAGARSIAVAGIVLYVAGLMWIGRSLAQVAQKRPPTTFATRSVLAAALWLLGSVIALGLILATASDWESAAEAADQLAAPLLVGFAAQLVIGALSFLIPVVLGGGPAAARSTNAILNRSSTARFVIVNLALLAVLLPVSDRVQTFAAVLVLAALASFIPLAISATLTARHMRQTSANPWLIG